MQRKKISEMTGTGAGGASFTPGTGEQNYGPASFVGGHKKKKKRIKESVSFTPEKRESIYKDAETKLKGYQDSLQKYMNIISNLTLEDIIKNPQKMKNIILTGEKLDEVTGKMYNQLDDMSADYDDEGDKQSSDKFSDLSNKYHDIERDAYDAAQLIQDIEYKIDDFREDKQELIAKLFK